MSQQSLLELVERAAGQGAPAVRAAGRLMSLMENQPHRLPELLHAAAGAGRELPHPRLLLGVTGAPGSGKSTLTDSLVAEYRRLNPGKRVGVVAVDPSSPFSGGAVLGDRVRMMRHATDPMVYVRSLASRGHLGGLSLGVKGVVRVMGLLGCDVVIIETVGVGQSEVEIAGVADRVLVVLAPGQGDSVQLLKAGLMEIGDILVVNKADRPGADQLHTQIMGALQMAPAARGHHGESADPGEAADLAMQARGEVEVALVSAVEHTGIDDLVEMIEARQEEPAEHKRRRQRAAEQEVEEAILEVVRRRLLETIGSNDRAADQVRSVIAGEADVSRVADELLDRTVARRQTNGTPEPGRTAGGPEKEAS
ncbi:MAG: methylmalonyl Co-A mutase-associated GTPase MeaB [Phycisphaeraceae bacterium]